MYKNYDDQCRSDSVLTSVGVNGKCQYCTPYDRVENILSKTNSIKAFSNSKIHKFLHLYLLSL